MRAFVRRDQHGVVFFAGMVGCRQFECQLCRCDFAFSLSFGVAGEAGHRCLFAALEMELQCAFLVVGELTVARDCFARELDCVFFPVCAGQSELALLRLRRGP